MGNGDVRRWRALAAWVVSVALFASAVGGAVLLPAEAATAQIVAPAATGSVPDVELTVGDAARTVAAADYFTGAVTSYGATSANTAVASVSTLGSTITLTPSGAGSTTVTVTATNTAGSATQTFTAKVLPTGCVVTLGALTAGSIATRISTWASDDGCRATNATSAAHNHYARYITFTVAEPLEARITLSSTQGKRLYLLEGTGTGGALIDSAGTYSTTSAASLWEPLQAGTYTLETTTYYTNREADFSLTIDSMALSPPAACVTSLGTITAGAIVTEQGSWDRDDGCRSVNATTSQATRYYARYVSFTVDEPLEARITLSSTQAKRLYLLEGAGTDGALLDSAGTYYSTYDASLWEVLQPGTYTLEITTYYAAREADFSVSIDSMALSPPAACVTSLGTLTAGAIVSETGSWDRDDACRSLHATTNQATRYYARYVSFTVDEPLEARITLSSTQAKRLYLLEGAGTDGALLDSAGTYYSTYDASLWEVLQPGTYTLEITTYYAAREADFSVSIDSMALSPPAACVTSLGTITAGAIVSETGSWDRDDACRSLHATTNQATRYYARYVSFTVSEPLEAWFRLSSPQAKRLYLLEGAGTDGALLDSAGTYYSSYDASLWEVLQPGTYTLEITTYYAAREADFSLSIDSMALSPPAACVTSLGTITAGAIVTEQGSWDRDEGCRSVHRTTSQSARYYAQYYSFTVSEPLEAWFRLSSPQGKYLYLLEGAGTDGALLDSAGTSSTTSAASLWEPLQAGTYTLEMTTRYTNREADFSLSIDSMALSPPASCVTSLGTITAGAIVTEQGSWDRDEGCRSVHRTTSQSARYYAQYYSFTVSEPLEAWFRLSSPQGKYLYLLEGAGTDGALLDSAGTSSTTSAASLWEPLQAGTYTLEMTTRYTNREADFSLSIDSMALTPPASCVTSLGTITAGAIVTEQGSWDRDEGCRSVHRTTSQSARYYAQYYSFTVSEPLEAWFRLSSPQGKYLYLLEGAGTDGALLDSAGTYSTTSAASLWEPLQAGTYTLEMTTRYTNREADFSLSIDSMALSPPAACVTSLGALTAGAIVTEQGSWDRDEGCRSVHRTTSQSARYYAQYYSFTVSEPLEAWFRLSSPQGKYLYLLEGAGTDGALLDSAGTYSTTSAASLWEPLQAGTYTLEMTTYYTNREADFSLSIDSMALSPPAACVTSLGALTAGSITTQAGSWDRDDGCRSVHATSYQSSRYYAQYYSFTVSEPLEAWFRLSSPQGKYLYLLEGAGTGGALIDSAGTSSTTSAASLWEPLQAGTYTLEMTTYYTNREADFSLSIDSMALSPPAACVTSLGALTAGSITTQAGSWDRDDGCRSVHATSYQSSRYYAQYYSFTVSEPLEAWFRLSSPQGKRLYLLEGAGTGGALIDSAGTSSTTSAASLWEPLQAGTYTLEMTTYYTNREADFSLSIDSMALSPPAACVTSLGALTAGSITTQAGSWDRDDGCRSVHATSYQSSRYYAQYYSFTVSEPLEAWFRLSSPQGKRLYLLEGAGTGGALIDSAGTSSTTSAASLWEPLQAGTYTLEMTTYYTNREADFSLSIDSMALSPPAACVTSLGALTAGSITTQAGSWDRDDGCRSVHATSYQSSRYYAQYYSFTVSEPLEAWFRLSSPQGKRLYLLEGAGTGGALIDSAGTSSTTSAASLWEPLQAGTYTLEMTTYYTNREADFSLSIDSMALSPPAACVTSLGALTAGSITTQAGSWDRDDGCRSINATSYQSARYYAQYYSFTVSEPLEARITLSSSSQGKRLYLLEGAGTGGGVVDSANTHYVTSSVALWEVLQPGTYTIETSAYYTNREADFTLSVSLVVLAPTRGDALAAQTIPAQPAAAQVDVSGAFNGTVESYAATSSNASIVTTSVGGSVVTLNGVAVGTATVTVTATNAAGSATQSFAVTVRPVAAPQTAGTLAAQTLPAVASATVDVAAAFTGTVDTYGATSSDTAVVTVSTTGSVLTLSGVAAGSATVTVTATNTTGSASQSFAVTVNPPAPTATGTLAVQTLPAAASIDVDVAAAFAGTVDTYGATSSDTAVLTVSTTGSVLTLTGVAAGSATVTVVATNTAGSASQSFAVTVNPPAPTTIGTLAAQTLTAGVSVRVDVAAGFSGTVDAYGATSGDTAVVTVTTSGSVITLSGVAAGTATVTVTATNTTGSASQSFAVTVAPSAPTATGTLAAQTLPAGDSVDVDIAGAFSGTVDSYVVTSSNGAVLDVALAGSVVTLTGVAAGSATVTVVAANTAGSATQTMAVTVNLPPAPTLGAQLAAQTLQVSETLAVDIASGFNGRIDSYTAAVGDTNTLTVSVDGSQITLTGVAVGSTTVTVTAINAAGRAARSFNVTVRALTAPQTANPPVARTIAVGEELPIHIADAFSGIIATYGAASNNTTVATVSVDGPVVTLTGVAAGTATVTLGAANTAGRATATLPVTVQAPEELTIAVAAPSHCLGSEGTRAPGGGRRGVGHIDVTYTVTGGAGPYLITSPDTTQTATEPTGTLTISCAQRGIDLTTATPDVNVVEAGPRTVTITATDNTGTTASVNIGIEIAEDAYTTEYNNGQMHEGKTYVLGTPDDWVLITLPQGLTLQFAGLSEHNMAHFTEPTTGAEILLDWTTGTELGRTIPTTPTITALLNALAFTESTGVTHGADSTEWRPYRDLPASHRLLSGKALSPQVVVHSRMLIGEPIRVCALPANIATPADNQAFKENVEASAEAWNDSIKDPQLGGNPSFPRDLFEFHYYCAGTIELVVKRVEDIKISDSKYCSQNVLGCAKIRATGNNPPMIGGTEIIVATSVATDRLVIIHELAHFLGLGDFFMANDAECGSLGTTPEKYVSVMALGACGRDSIQERDLKDLHKVYHPDARTSMQFEAIGSSRWGLNAGDPPPDTGEGKGGIKYVSNAAAYVMFRRSLGSVGPYYYVGSFHRAWSLTIPAAVLSLLSGREEIEGYEFLVFGVTGGDIKQSSSTGNHEHLTLSLDLGSITFTSGFHDWTLGTSATIYGPPTKPTNVQTEPRSREVDVIWAHVRGATDYDVYWHKTENAIEDPTTTSGDPRSFLGKQNVGAATRTSCGLRVTFDGLANGTNYYFRVRANRNDVELRGRLSAEVSGRPYRIPPGYSFTRGLSEGPSGEVGQAVPFATSSPRGSNEGPSGEVGQASSAASCTLPEEVDPVVVYECPTDDGHDWVLREDVGGDWWCDWVDDTGEAGVVSTNAWRCEASAGVPRVEAGGAVVCEREVSGTVRSRPGPPECEEGFSLVTTLEPVGVLWQVCSRTDSVPATPGPPECPSGYSLVTTPLPFSSPLPQCKKSVPATATPGPPECPSGYSLVTFGSVFCYDSVAATATPGPPECPSGYTLVTTPLPFSSPLPQCKKSVPATATPGPPECPSGYSLVTFWGVFCYDSVAATATPGPPECPSGYSLVTTPLPFSSPLRQCKDSVPATATPGPPECPSGYSLVTFWGVFCYDSVAATATPSYSCPSGYSLVTTPLPFSSPLRQCKDSVAATATYSCPSGYTLSGTSCYKYLYTSPTGGSCPSGYTLTYNGLFYLCRKKVTTTVTVTYDCDDAPAGYTLSGTRCTDTVAPTVTNTYDCDDAPAGYTLSGTLCTDTVAPTVTNTYDCDDAPAGYTLSGTLCTDTVAPTYSNTYDCDDAPAGYTLSGTLCTDTVTPTYSNTYDCDDAPAGYTLSGTLCTDTVTPTYSNTYDCDDAPAGYTLWGTLCTDTVTPTYSNTYDCDDAPAGYTLSGTLCTDTVTPTYSNTYDCDDAPAGYTLSGQDCIKITTQDPTPTTIYYCDPGYTLNPENNTCTGTITTTPTKITIDGCPTVPPGEPHYQLVTTTTATTTTKTCTRTITVTAETTHTCPSGYNPVVTVGEDGISLTSCRLD